jgi:TolA-binding protein
LANALIDQIDYAQITGWELFNEAERFLRDGQWLQAMEQHESALAHLESPDAPDSGAGQLDRPLLVLCRLTLAADRQGRFDTAVEAYCRALLRAGSDAKAYLHVIRPSNLPAAGSTLFPVAAKHVDQAIELANDQAVRHSLRTWQTTWPRTTLESASSAIAQAAETQATAASPNTSKPSSSVQATQPPARPARGSASQPVGPAIPEGYYQQGLEHTEKADVAGRSDDTKTRRVELKRAALAFLRVVVHFPGHARGPESLYRAGRVMVDLDQPEAAGRLWLELIQRYPGEAPWADRARSGLAGLRSAGDTKNPSEPGADAEHDS